MKFMVRSWDNVSIDQLKTLIRITFSEDIEISGKEYTDSRTIEYSLTPRFTINEVIEDQQRKLTRDIINYVGKDLMDEVREVMV